MINIAVLVANLWVFIDNPEIVGNLNNKTFSETEITHIEKPVDEIQQDLPKIENTVLDVTTHQNSGSRINKQQKALLKKQTLELTYLQAENKRLSEQLSRTENQINAQNRYLAKSLQREKNLNQNLAVERLRNTDLTNLSLQPIDRIKAAIEQQPDLLKTNYINKSEAIEKTLINNQVFTDDNYGERNKMSAVTAKKKRLTGAVEFGFSYEQDNQVTKSVKGRLILDYDKPDNYNINSDLEFEFESEDGENSTDKLRWQLQSNRNLDPMNLIFARSDIQRSQFASYRQEDTFAIGYGRIFFNDNNHKFNTEIGPGYKSAIPNDGEDAVSVNEFILRTRLNYERIVSENLQLIIEGVFETGHSNSVYSVEFRAQNKIYRQLYLTFDINYKYNQNVPVETVNQEVSTGFNVMYAF